MTDDVEYAAAVKHAAAQLDIDVPGWHNLIDESMLEMVSCSQCVLGQVFGPEQEQKLDELIDESLREWVQKARRLETGYEIGMEALGLYSSHHVSEDMSRNAPRYFPSGMFTFGLSDRLRCHWINEIAERRATEELTAEAAGNTMSANHEEVLHGK